MSVWGVGMGRGLRILAALLLLSLGLSACGGGDDGGGESDEQKVEEAIEFALTSTDPSACGEYRTIAFMEETTSGTGAAAVRECEQSLQAGAGLVDSVTVAKIEIEDGTAHAEVAFEGGDGDGLVANVVLVEEDGSWKIDDFTGLAGVDRDRVEQRIVKQLEKEGMPTLGVSCLADGLAELPQADLEGLVLGDDEALVTEIAKDCEASLEDEQLTEAEQEELGQIEREVEQEPTGYPNAVKQNFLSSCLATSGANFEGCECMLSVIEGRYSLGELKRAEANLASGEMREMIEYALAACA